MRRCGGPRVAIWEASRPIRPISPGKRRSMKMGSHRRAVGPMAASAAPQTRRCGKRLRAPGGSSENSSFWRRRRERGPQLDAANRTFWPARRVLRKPASRFLGQVGATGQRNCPEQLGGDVSTSGSRVRTSIHMNSDCRFLSFAELAIGFSQAPSGDLLTAGDAGNRP